MLGLDWRGEVVGGGSEGQASPHEGEARSLSPYQLSCRWWRRIGSKRAASMVDVPKLLPAGYAVAADAVVVIAALVR